MMIVPMGPGLAMSELVLRHYRSQVAQGYSGFDSRGLLPFLLGLIGIVLHFRQASWVLA